MRNVLRLLRLVGRYWAAFIGALALLALSGAMEGAKLAMVQPMFDRVLRVDSGGGPVVILNRIPGTQRPLYLDSFLPHGFSHNVATVVLTVFVLAVIVGALAEYLGTYLTGVVGFGVVTDLRNALYEKLIHQSVAFFHRHTTGRLMSTVVNDIDRIQVAASSGTADALQQGFTFLFVGALMLHYNWRLTVGLLLLAPLVLIPTARLGRRVRGTTRRTQDELAGVQDILHETLTGHRIVKAFSMEHHEIQRFRDAARRLLRFNLRYLVQQGLSSPMMEMLGAVTLVAFVWYGRSAIGRGQMTEGTVVTYLLCIAKIYDPLRRMAGIYNSFQTALGASQHVFEFMDADEEVCERPNARRLRTFHSQIRFAGVDFEYEPGRPLLRGLDFHIDCSEVVALVGSSGAGKTTLANLIPRFFDVTGGAVSLDAIDVRDLTLKSLRDQIAYVTQDTILFNDTVAGNIAYGSADATPHRVRLAAAAALAEEFIEAMPEGYETRLGERGLRLSGGQRQRIAIARALLKDAPILILDEATSALDSESEALVQRALGNLMRNRTVLVIAHRLSTVRSADRILVLEGGVIVASGNHDALYAEGGLYRRLYDLQFLDREQVARG